MSMDNNVLESARAREIVQVILDFGVSELQKKKIIKLLALELEDLKMMQNISSLIDQDTNEAEDSKPKLQI